MFETKDSESIKLIPVVNPDALAVGAYSEADIAVAKFSRAMFLLHLGVIGAASTFDVTVQHADISGGTYATIFTATQLVQADDEQIHYLDIDLTNPDIKPYLKINVTVAGAAGDGGALLLLDRARSEPVTQPTDVAAMAGTWAV